VPWFSIFAVYFIIWWLTLFIMLPIGMRSQADENDVTLGTVESAPAHFRFWRVMLMTTVVAALINAVWWIASSYFGISIDSIPRFVPVFDESIGR
jgi:predicted secreted protein